MNSSGGGGGVGGGRCTNSGGGIGGLQITTQTSNQHPNHETHTTASLSSSPTSSSPNSPTSATTTRHHSRSTTLTPREQLPPTLKMSMYTGEFLALVGGNGSGDIEQGIDVIFGDIGTAGGKRRKRRGDVMKMFDGQV